MLKHPIQWIVLIAGGCLLSALILLGIGFAFDLPTCKTVAKWLWVVGVLVSFVPLVGSLIFLKIERFKKRK
jgi:uncharacterized membrane protein